MTFNYSMTKLTRLLSFNSSDRAEVCDNIHNNISSLTKSVLKHVTNHSSTRKAHDYNGACSDVER